MRWYCASQAVPRWGSEKEEEEEEEKEHAEPMEAALLGASC